MTKRITPETLAELPVMVDNFTKTSALVPREDGADHWQRQTALEFAITFHKNNGGMSQPNQVVGTATIFLAFIQGDSK
jgi:hypothetical protein